MTCRFITIITSFICKTYWWRNDILYLHIAPLWFYRDTFVLKLAALTNHEVTSIAWISTLSACKNSVCTQSKRQDFDWKIWNYWNLVWMRVLSRRTRNGKDSEREKEVNRCLPAKWDDSANFESKIRFSLCRRQFTHSRMITWKFHKERRRKTMFIT